ncbi:hypothetical protein U9M48_026080 [Paspalum notatum var. saurae]|uniref:Uncharacterized protein n=1 Tax=Paspalum notatum var. saurae TaxID=547442 RepID=A0AAQ3TUK7_PASNO
MPCALEVIDTRLQSTSHIRCNRSFDRNICSHFSKDHLIRIPVYLRPDNRDTALTALPLGHNSDWKPAPFLAGIQEVNKVIPLTSGDPGIERQSAQPRILCCLGQPNEGNMHDQADSAEPVSNGNPHGGSTLIQSRQKKTVCNSLTACPPCHVVAKKLSRPVTTTHLSDSDILHDDDKPSKWNPRRKGNKKGKQYKRVAHRKLNLTSENTFEDNTYGVSPVEVHPTSLPVDILSETTSSACSLVKEAHMGKSDGEKNNAYADCVAMMNSSTLGTDEVDGSDCACSSNSVAGGRLSYSFGPCLNGEPHTTDSSEFDGSTFTEHGLGEERNSKKLPCACVYKPNCATTDYFFSRWNNDNNGNYNANVEATLSIKDENRHDHLQLGPSTGSNNVRTECQLLESHLSYTHAEDTIGPLGSRSCSSKDITDSCIHTERVQCSSEACSSKPSLQISSRRRNGKSRKTPSYSDLTVSHRAAGANRHKNNGRDTSAVWQKVERNGKIISKGHSGNSPVQDKGAREDNYKGVQEDPTKWAKHNQNRKACRQDFPNGAVELDCTKEEEDAFSSCQTFSRPIYKKQAPFLCQQRSSSSKQASQSSKNYYAPRNDIHKVPKVYLHQEELPMSQLVQAKDTSDRSTSNSCSADEVVTGVGSNCPNEKNESSQSGIEIAASVSCNLVPDLAAQGDSDDAHVSDPHSLCPENKGVSTSWSSRNLCTDPCAAETEEAWCVKLTTENNSQESCKWYSPAGQLSQKWVPVGKKETSNVIHLDFQEALVVEDSVPANDISYSVGPVSTNGEDSKLASEMTSKLNSLGHVGLEWRAHNGTETDYSRIKEAISYVYTAKQRVEDIHHRIGRPIADFEQFVYSASPVVHCNPCLAGCTSYLQKCVKDGLHLHQTPEITLSSVWQWYEEPGCYGLEVKAQDFHRSKDFSSSHHQFTSYFVPYLSAVQLFAQPKRSKGGSTDKEGISPNLNPPPIFAKLLPQQSNSRNRSSTLCAEDQANGKLIFEFFESEQPYCRRQLFDKVNELIAGVKQLNGQISGDPKSLELSLHDLHPASWYCVAWYPIFRIPDGKFQAAFLTYHSLGHWTHRSSGADLGVVLPVVGLQSYNDKGERWFEMGEVDPCEDGGTAELRCSEASQALKQRLNEAAAVMSRASVLKEEQTSRNRHPDYEFFISRRRG